MEKVREHPEMRGVNLHEMKNDDRVRPVPSNALSAWAVSMMKCCAAAGAWAARRASGRGGGRAGGGRAGVQARGRRARGRRGPECARSGGGSLPAVDPANVLAMDPRVRRRGAQGVCERQVEIYNGFSPCRPAKRWISQPLARGGVASPADRRVWGSLPPAKTTCPQQRRRYPGFASTGACRFIAHVRMVCPAASRG